MEENVIKGYLAIKGEQGLSAYEVAVANGYTGTELEWVNSLGSANLFNQYKTKIETTDSTSIFDLPSEYIEDSFLDIYVDGLHIPSNEYVVEQNENKYQVHFNNPVDSNKVVELIVTILGSANFPISDVINANSTNDTATGSKAVYDKLLEIENNIPTLNNIVDTIYPIGSIYLSVNSGNPATIFPGTTWEQIKDRFLLASGNTYANGSSGGSANAVVVSHSHTMSTAGAHTHDVYTRQATATGNAKSEPVSSATSTERKATTSAGNHSHSIYSSGVSGVGKNMPPYLAVNVWKRTA